ncbi:MAG: CvpA family protein [Bacteroidales bacterium]|nr:CvpA family protein [Bacteroidales bacterium]
MAILDIILLLCFVPAIVSGISKGFIKQAVDLVAILVAAWAAFHFSTVVADWLSQYITLEKTILNVVSFILIAIVVALLLNLVGSLITNAMKALSLGFINRLLGLVFAVLKVGLLLGLLILVFESLNSTLHLVKPESVSNAVVYNFLKDAAERIFPILKTFVTGGNDPVAPDA